MHLTAPSHWSRSIGTSGRDPSESAVTIAGMRNAQKAVISTRYLLLEEADADCDVNTLLKCSYGPGLIVPHIADWCIKHQK
jgi:hypothetical protein